MLSARQIEWPLALLKQDVRSVLVRDRRALNFSSIVFSRVFSRVASCLCRPIQGPTSSSSLVPWGNQKPSCGVFPAKSLQNRSQENCFNRLFSFVSSDLPRICWPIHRSTISYQYTQDRNITIASHFLVGRKGLSAMSVPWLRQSLPRVKQFSKSVVVFTELVAGHDHAMGIVKDLDIPTPIT